MYSVLRLLSSRDGDAADAIELLLSAIPGVSRVDNSFAITVADSQDIQSHVSKFSELWNMCREAIESQDALNAEVCFDIAIHEYEYRNMVMKELVFSPDAMEYFVSRKISVAVSIYGYFPEAAENNESNSQPPN